MSPSQDLFTVIRTGDSAQLATLLAEQPALVNARSPQGISAVLWAHYTGQTDLLPTLLAANPQLDIHDMAAMGDLSRLRALLASNPSLAQAYSSDGFTALHYVAFFNGNTDLASSLLEAGAEVDAVARNDQQVTPLHSAAAHRHNAVIQLLLAHGANVNARQENGETPLMEAAQNGDTALVGDLLARGADPLLATDDGRTAAHFAETAGHTDLAATLRGKVA
jgi:ankyrin repeat protein